MAHTQRHPLGSRERAIDEIKEQFNLTDEQASEFLDRFMSSVEDRIVNGTSSGAAPRGILGS